MNFKIVADDWTAQVCYRKVGPLEVAQSADYQTARNIARSQSRETSGRFLVMPPEGSLIRPEAFTNGISEG